MKSINHFFGVTVVVMAILMTISGVTSAKEPIAPALAKGVSSIADVAGFACVRSDMSREATREEAMTDAKQKAREYVISLIKARTATKKGSRKSDMVSAYVNGTIRVLGEPKEKWFKDPTQGECCEVQVKMEVIPEGKKIETLVKNMAANDPSVPLMVKVWTDKSSYKEGDKFRVFIKSNKSFYGTVVYQDASGTKVQLLPNPYRKENYFEGNKEYELPSAADKYDLVVTPPFGGEKITVFASTSPLGELNTEPAGKVFLVTGSQEQIAATTRSIKFVPKNNETGTPKAAEFFEATAELSTGKK